jgi:hypothetical protein
MRWFMVIWLYILLILTVGFYQSDTKISFWRRSNWDWDIGKLVVRQTLNIRIFRMWQLLQFLEFVSFLHG